MTTCAGVEANLNGSKCERKLDKNKSTPKEYFVPLVRFDAESKEQNILKENGQLEFFFSFRKLEVPSKSKWLLAMVLTLCMFSARFYKSEFNMVFYESKLSLYWT